MPFEREEIINVFIDEGQKQISCNDNKEVQVSKATMVEFAPNPQFIEGPKRFFVILLLSLVTLYALRTII